MSFAIAQARCNATALQRFGVPVQLDGVTVQGDPNAAMKAHQVGGMEISAVDPMCTVADADVPDKPVGRSLVWNEKAYKVRDLRGDGLGLTVLILETARRHG